MSSEPDPEKIPSFTFLETIDEFIERTPDGIHILDEKGIILFANQRELKMLGYKKEEFVGHHIFEFHTDKKYKDFDPSFFSIDQNMINLETNLKCKDGTVKDFLVSCNAHFEDGK